MVQQKEETGKEHVPETMAKLRRVTAKLFLLITGIEDLRQIRLAHLSRFRDMLHKIPKSCGKGPNDAMIDMGASDRAHQDLAPRARARDFPGGRSTALKALVS